MATPRRDRGRVSPPLADGAPSPWAAALPLPYLCTRTNRLTTSGDAEERQRTRGPWTDWMVFGGAGHTAARTPSRTPGLVLVLVFVVLVWLVVHVVRPPEDASRKGNKGACLPKSVFSKA